jgi:hypothetical protein
VSARAFGEAAPKAPKAMLHALTQKQLGQACSLQRIEDMLSEDSVRSAASSPCLGSRDAIASIGQLAAAAGGHGKITALGQLSRMAGDGKAAGQAAAPAGSEDA